MTGSAHHRKVLIGVDSSDEAEDALVLGGLLCDPLGASALVLSVVETPRSVARALVEDDYLRRVSEAIRARAAERLRGHDQEFRAYVSESPAGVLFERAELDDAAVIVVGSTRRGPLGRVHPGSVAESLLHGAAGAVAIAPRGFRARDDIALGHIAVAYDGLPESERALSEATALAGRLDASLTILTVSGATRDEARRQALGAAVARVSAEGREARGILLSGDPATALAEASAGFDLLLAGSRAHGLAGRVLLGTVSGRLAREAHSPLIVVPRGTERPLLDEGTPERAGAGA